MADSAPTTTTTGSGTAPAPETATASGTAPEVPSTTATEAAGTKPEGEKPAGEKPAGEKPTGEKPEGEKPAGEKPAGEKPEDQMPDEYEDFKAPEGVALDVEVAAEFKSLAKDLKLPQGKAQQVADLGVKLAQKWEAKQAEAISETVAKWEADSRADKEFGGDKLAENQAVAKKALDMFGSDALKQLLVQSGLGNHPEIIRAFYRAGKAISEDGIVTGQQRAPAQKDLSKVLYPNQS